jgi:8-oxo-dGTP pyrophosphatase MutT (NUDIX family)
MLLEDVAERLSHRLPAVHDSVRSVAGSGMPGLRTAAVLVALFPDGGEAEFLLTRRPHTLTNHPGQIALPGGGVEASDGSAWEAALRETWEEVGIPSRDVMPVGRLAPVHAVVSSHLILPFVGRLASVPQVAPHPDEVDEVFPVSVASLLDPSNVREEVWNLREGRPYRVVYFWIGGHVVWGLTARILSDLARQLGAALGPYPPGSVRPA